MDLFIYLRKSRKDIEEERKALEDGREYDTLDRHRRTLLEVAKKENHNIIAIYEEIETGESVIERPEAQKMLKEMDHKAVDAVLVMDIDRLGRGDMYDAGIIDRAFRYNDIKLVTPTEVYDPEDESWELVFGVKSIVARQELKSITKRLQGGRIDKAKQGRSISKKPPYGYLRDDNLILYPNPDTAWVVKKIFEMMRDGNGRQTIALELDKLGIAPPNSERENWSPSSITSIIKNEVYLGHIIWGVFKSVKRNGKYIRKKMPPEKWTRKDHAHEAIVTKDLWESANKAHTGRFRPSTTSSYSLSNPLAGILKCEKCGFTLMYQPRPDRPNDYIRCVQSQCKAVQKGATLNLVEERIISALHQYVDQFIVHEDIRIRTEDTSIIPFKEKAIEKRQRELDELTKQKNNLHDLLERGVYDIDTFLERQQSIVERMKSIEEDIKQLQDEVKKEEFRDKNIHEFIPKVKKVLEAYQSTKDVEKKNRLLKSVLAKATYLRKKDWNKKDEFVIQLFPRL